MAKLNRRIFLRGLGGALVAAPFLGSLFERSARAGFVAPKRTIVMFTHYGHITNNWFPIKLDGDLTEQDLKGTTLEALAPYARKLLMPRGIRSMNEWTGENTGVGHGRGQGNDIHTQIAASAFTCQPVTPNSNDPYSFNNATKNAMPIGPSLDHVLAKQLSPAGVPLLLNMAGIKVEGPMNSISYSASQTVFEAKTASDAFANLTGLLNPSAPMNPDTYQLVRGKLISDLVKDDLSSLARRDMSKADKEKLAAWLELTNDIGKVVAAAQCDNALAETLGASVPLNLDNGNGDIITRKVNDSMDNADVYNAIAALTAACNANPVIFLKYPGAFLYTGLGINSDADSLAHSADSAQNQGACVANVVQDIKKIDAYHARKFFGLVRMLDSIPEGDSHTVLDNTITVWMSDCSDGGARNLNNAPIIQAGSGGGYFKTGKVIDLDPGTGATAEIMLGRSLSQCVDGTNMMVNGVSQGTGTPPMFGNAPVNKYFCNIMNALGLKADAQGFPAKDGPNSEVSHFGYSDLTTDFCGGEGAVPTAGIHNPGAFDALKA
ncbi:MAG TPA: DUF1552 domain-containing protein [Polyangiaceae bacterium]|nr:DUF1552 domain-containing protein [Polyangiaceae bacterium]